MKHHRKKPKSIFLRRNEEEQAVKEGESVTSL